MRSGSVRRRWCWIDSVELWCNFRFSRRVLWRISRILIGERWMSLRKMSVFCWFRSIVSFGNI